MSGERRVSPENLAGLVSGILEKYGMPKPDAEITADHLVRANLRGVDTHGVIRLKGYLSRIEAGGNNPKANVRIISETPTSAVMDGDNALGQVGGRKAMELAVKKAESSGMCLVAMRNCNHYGMAAYYSMMAIEKDMIGLSMTNVLACMAPTGGAAGRFGNNPICVAFPCGQEPPVVIDFAASKSSWGKAMVCNQTGDPLPEGCFTDAEGTPTRDAAKFLDGGTLLPIAEHKGYGIALGISLLTVLLSDGPFDTEIPHLYKKLNEAGQNSYVMGAVKISSFVDVQRFKDRIDGIVRMMRDTPRAPGIARIYLPGEIEYETEKERKENGIPLNAEMTSELVSLAKKLEMDPASYSFLE